MQRLSLKEDLHLFLNPRSEKNNRCELPPAIILLTEIKFSGGASRQEVLNPGHTESSRRSGQGHKGEVTGRIPGSAGEADEILNRDSDPHEPCPD